jgi:TPR repeat protein
MTSNDISEHLSERKASLYYMKAYTQISIAALYETTQMFFNGWKTKQTVVHPYYGIILSD